ncbi:CBS domain-containing protein [Paenirhodobacter populi]|uniref:CBS domain-containing protein n=1 Tax=Paenirhodobacter populi TaxID=2306993 RepID=UPI000FE3AC38|nr:CBS domain-containing protein [Sinirhodobacter populi]RWR09457.1 CBS domain-containing protein [Sinirhodobacter populi]
MQVLQILKSKGDASVITVPPEMTITAAARLLSEKRIGAVVVSGADQHADGMLSERDIVREVGRQGAAALELTVDAIMTRKIVSCTRTDTIEDVLERMTAGRFRHLPVIEEGEMVGLISIGDAVKARLEALHMEKEALTGMIMGT